MAQQEKGTNNDNLKADDEKVKSASSSSLMSDNDGTSDDAIPFSMNVDHTILKLEKEESRKIMIAMDNSEYSKKAIDFVYKDLLKDNDAILLITIWEEAMVNKLVQELDSKIIHPQQEKEEKTTDKFNTTFQQANCLKNHEKVYYIYLI